MNIFNIIVLSVATIACSGAAQAKTFNKGPKPASSQSSDSFTCSGYEPGWLVTLKGSGGQIEAQDIATSQSFAVSQLSSNVTNTKVFAFDLSKSRVKAHLVVKEEACRSAGEGPESQFTHSAILILADQFFDGCCRLAKR